MLGKLGMRSNGRHLTDPIANPRDFRASHIKSWSAEEKADFIDTHRDSRAMQIISVHLLLSDELRDILHSCVGLVQYINAADQKIINYMIDSIWVEHLIKLYLHENEGRIKDNLKYWVRNACAYKDVADANELLQTHILHNHQIIPYVIQYDPPSLPEFPSPKNYAEFMAIVKEISETPDVAEFIRICGLHTGCNMQVTMDDYMNFSNLRDVLHSHIAQIHYARAFIKFEAIYGAGIPPELCKWELANEKCQKAVALMREPWHKNRAYIIKSIIRTPVMCEIYYMFQK
jgi:hypothetical protein